VSKYQNTNSDVHLQAVLIHQAVNTEMLRSIQPRYKKNTNMRLWKSKVNSGMAYDPDFAYRTDSCIALGSMTYKCLWCNA